MSMETLLKHFNSTPGKKPKNKAEKSPFVAVFIM